ncbi:MAG TPA: ferrous iron transport protein B [Candidatus Kapabacteria bacterium]|nr:ferrous iron transport protein B [Candidatus Kapabacteria bacterium]
MGAERIKTICLVGQPNAGKSTLFNVLSDIKSSTSNFAGTSVKVMESKINIYGETIRLIDLPGTYSLNYTDIAEKVTFDYLLKEKVDLVINVVDASILSRSLELTQEIIEMGIPMVVALNMTDEAESIGLEINNGKLEELLNVKVVPTTAIFGKGVRNLIEVAYYEMQKTDLKSNTFKFTAHIEDVINVIENDITAKGYFPNINPRFIAIKCIENPSIIQKTNSNLDTDVYDDLRKKIEAEHHKQCFETISYERHHISMSLSEKIAKQTKKERGPFSRKLDNYLLDPIFGYVALILFFAVMFFVIFYVGSTITGILDPLAADVIASYQSLRGVNMLLFLTVDGLFQGIVGAVGIVMPYFVPLILMMSFFEETGYIARVAFLVDGVFNKIGLNGKSVAAFIMGIGCNIPAIYATRILESHRDRVISAILIPFVPCSARVSVIFALTAAFAGPLWAVIVFLFVILVIAINGKVLARFLKKPTSMVLEIPELRRPSIKVSLGKTYFKLMDFMREAAPYLIIGSIVLAYIEYLNVAKYLDYVFYPVVHTLLDLPSQLGSTLIFGFLRKELILVMASQAMGVATIADLPLTTNQIIVFIIFVTLYFPCITTFFVLVKEFGYKVAFGSAGLSIVVATIGALLFRIYFEIVGIIV